MRYLFPPAFSSSPQTSLDPILPPKKCYSDKWEEILWWLLPSFSFLSLFPHMHFQELSFLEGSYKKRKREMKLS